MGNELQHRTVLLEEAVDALVTRADGVYVDGTFGRGGHSRLVLSRLGESGGHHLWREIDLVEIARRLELLFKQIASATPNHVDAARSGAGAGCRLWN